MVNTGFEEVKVNLDENGRKIVKVFQGKMLARTQITDQTHEMVYRLYETPRGKLACVVRKNPVWQGSGGFDYETWGEIARDSEWWQPHYQLHIAESLDELATLIGDQGDKIVQALQSNPTSPQVEYLDI